MRLPTLKTVSIGSLLLLTSSVLVSAENFINGTNQNAINSDIQHYGTTNHQHTKNTLVEDQIFDSTTTHPYTQHDISSVPTALYGTSHTTTVAEKTMITDSFDQFHASATEHQKTSATPSHVTIINSNDLINNNTPQPTEHYDTHSSSTTTTLVGSASTNEWSSASENQNGSQNSVPIAPSVDTTTAQTTPSTAVSPTPTTTDTTPSQQTDTIHTTDTAHDETSHFEQSTQLLPTTTPLVATSTPWETQITETILPASTTRGTVDTAPSDNTSKATATSVTATAPIAPITTIASSAPIDSPTTTTSLIAPVDPTTTTAPSTIPVEPATTATSSEVPVEPATTATSSEVSVEPATTATSSEVPVEPATTTTPTAVPIEPTTTTTPSAVSIEPTTTATPYTAPVEPSTTMRTTEPTGTVNFPSLTSEAPTATPVAPALTEGTSTGPVEPATTSTAFSTFESATEASTTAVTDTVPEPSTLQPLVSPVVTSTTEDSTTAQLIEPTYTPTSVETVSSPAAPLQPSTTIIEGNQPSYIPTSTVSEMMAPSFTATTSVPEMQSSTQVNDVPSVTETTTASVGQPSLLSSASTPAATASTSTIIMEGSVAPVSTSNPVPTQSTTTLVGPMTSALPSSISSSVNSTSETTDSDWWIPTRLLTETAAVETASNTVSTLSPSATKYMPQVIMAPGDVTVAEGYTLITIGFKKPLHYEFVVTQPKSSAQIISFLPNLLNQPYGNIFSNISVLQLVPLQDSSISYYVTVAEVYFPTAEITNLSQLVKDTSSILYTEVSESLKTLADMIDPSIPITGLVKNATQTVDGSSDGSDNASGSNSSSTSSKQGSSGSTDADSDNIGTLEFSSKSKSGSSTNSNSESKPLNKKKIIGLVVGVVAGAIMYFFLMGYSIKYLIDKYKKRQRSNVIQFPDDSSLSSNESLAVEKGKRNSEYVLQWMDDVHYGSERSNFSRSGSGIRAGNGSEKNTKLKISNPIATENSLGWHEDGL